jgi:uncharacterized protein
MFGLFLFINFIAGYSNANAITVDEINIDKYVNDYANVIDDTTESNLNNQLYNFAASTTNQILIVTVPDMSGDYIEHYAVKLFEKAKPGNAKSDNGVLVIAAIKERSVRIEVGYGLEPIVTDGVSNYIIKNIITPSFKNSDYAKGLSDATNQIEQVVSANVNDPIINAEANTNANNSVLKSFLISNSANIIIIIFFAAVTIIPWMAAILGRTKSWWAGGVIGLVLAIIIFYLILKTLLAFILVIIGLAFDYIVSKNYKEHASGDRSGPPDWWAGGSGFGGGWGSGISSGGFGGGFSGGGGSSGGGGASGSW